MPAYRFAHVDDLPALTGRLGGSSEVETCSTSSAHRPRPPRPLERTLDWRLTSGALCFVLGLAPNAPAPRRAALPFCFGSCITTLRFSQRRSGARRRRRR